MLKRGGIGTLRSAAGTFGSDRLSAPIAGQKVSWDDFRFWFAIPHTLSVMS